MLRNIFKQFSSRNTPRWIVLCIDLYIVANTFVLAILIRLNTLNINPKVYIVHLPVVVGIALLCFLVVGSYKGIIRHTGVRDAANVMAACFLLASIAAFIVLVNRQLLIFPKFTIPLTIISIHFLLNVVFLVTSRFVFKELYKLFVSLKVKRKVLIYGAGETGLLTYSVLRDLKDSQVQIVGFLDDDKRKVGKKINGLPVLNTTFLTKKFIKSKNISDIIISFQNAPTSRLLEIVDNLSELNVQVKIVPPANTWIEQDLKAQQIKNVRIEDLLGRKPIEIENPSIKKELEHKVILITGAAGSIGSEIVRQISSYKYKFLVLIDQSESALYDLEQELILKGNSNFVAIVADIRGKSRMQNIFDKYQPQLIFHAAAYKHVPLMEANPYEAVNVNILGTKIIVDLAIKTQVEKFVLISTDKAVNPTNVMGASKRIAEMYISSVKEDSQTKFITTRFGNVLGSNGSVIPLFKKQIEQGGPLTVTHKDITRYFMTIPEACHLVLEAGAMGQGGEIFVFNMGESIKIFDLALNMIYLSGLKYPEDINIKITGLRPGEKIFEELLATNENTIPTHHEKILIAKVQPQQKAINKEIDTLCVLNKEMDFRKTVAKMKTIVPNYFSENSKYQDLDATISK